MGGSDLGYVDLPNLKLEQDINSTVVLGNLDETMLIIEGVLGGSEFGMAPRKFRKSQRL